MFKTHYTYTHINVMDVDRSTLLLATTVNIE